MMRINLSFAFLLLSSIACAQTLCEDGYAGIYPCHNVDLLAHIPPDSIGGASTNEVWGWTDTLFNKEYVLLGMSTGIGFFDISTPTQPEYLGRLPSHTFNSLWRTLRTYGDYMYVGSEATGHGLQVFDLTELRDVINPPQIFSESAWYDDFGKCHTLVIDEEHGYLIACGTNTYLGGPHIVNIQNPLVPTLVGGYDGKGYTHEAQVITYNGPDADYTGKTILFCYNGSPATLLVIVDITDPTDIHFISDTSYPQPQYCHQGWLTPDGAYLLMDDELDEMDNGYTNTRTLIWDMHDLDAPLYMGQHDGSTAAIDHNQYIIGNLAFQSNYTAGLQILDVTNIADTTLKQVAYFDHYPWDNSTAFDGEWMNYPYFESGVVALSDLYNGMFLVRPNLIQLDYPNTICANGTFEFDIVLAEGFAGPYALEIEGLPLGAIVDFNTQNIIAPDTIHVIISSIVEFDNDLLLNITVSGAHFSYSRSLSAVLQQPTEWYEDADGDGFGQPFWSMYSCTQPEGTSTLTTDCEDNDPTIYPGAPGTADGVDNNCNNEIDPSEEYFCADLDGDYIITVNDLIIMNGELGCDDDDCIGDLNNDGFVNATDFLILLADFGEPCLP
ncbi:MAG: choice-of-anchor B family protein [Flavobacteriales bacterium]